MRVWKEDEKIIEFKGLIKRCSSVLIYLSLTPRLFFIVMFKNWFDVLEN